MEALERRHFACLVVVVLLTLCSSTSAQRNSTKMLYVCPPDFIRLGHSCYYFSEETANWQTAMFNCKYKSSNISVPARWEDRNLRKYLNRDDNVDKSSRWIGGIYDYATRAWKWGGELRRMHYQSFSKMKKMNPEELRMKCIAMMPELLFRWAPRSCTDERKYICQTKLLKVAKPKARELRKRWQRMGTPNEITAPTISREVDDRMLNDVTMNPVLRQKYGPRSGYRKQIKPRFNGNHNDVRPNELRKRSRPISRKLTRPFKGYTWNRRDPEGSYQRNVELLRSGRTGLSRQQIKAQLARLQHLRDRHIAKRKRLRERGEWLVNDHKQALAQTHVRTYMVDNNISALHPKTIVEEFDMFPPIAVKTAPVSRQARGSG